MAHLRETVTKRLWKIGIVLTAVFLLINRGPARADIILSLIEAGLPVGNDFQYTYAVTLTAGTVLHANGAGMNTANFFTLYDVQGLIAGSETYGGVLASNSSHTEQQMGVTPVSEIPFPPETGNFMNITTFWTGLDVNGAFDLGTFSFLSTNPLGSGLLAFTSASQKLEDLNLLANNTGQVAGPGPSASPAPEPCTLMLLAIGLPVVAGLGGLLYRRRN